MKFLRFHYLAELAREHGWTKGAELGVYRGETLFHLLETVPGLDMIAVDAFAHLPDEPDYYADWDHAANEFLVRMRMEDYPGRVRLIKATTHEAAAMVAPAWLDFVFIDADHRTEGVLRDIDDWRPTLRPGGWLLGDDYDWATVRAALDTRFPAGVTVGADDVWHAVACAKAQTGWA